MANTDLSGLKNIVDYDIAGKKILLRVDINSNIDSDTGKLHGEAPRINAIVPTLNALKDTAVVILAHQGRFGDSDCVSLKAHCDRLNELMDGKVQFIDDTFGDRAIEAIQALQPGEYLLLENVRMWEGEEKTRSIADAEKSELVTALSPYFDYFVNDAFGAAHRAQASLVGWPKMVAGPLVFREIEMLNCLSNPERPAVWLIGGSKALDKFKALKFNLEAGNIDIALVAGLTSLLFFEAQGLPVGLPNRGMMYEDYLLIEKDVKDVWNKYQDKIVLPVDLVFNDDGVRREIFPEKLADEGRFVGDIGAKTIKIYSQFLHTARTIVANGPPGIFEKKVYARGTFDLLKVMSEIADKGGFVEIGGGDLGEACEEYSHVTGQGSNIKVSTGGGALLEILSGKDVPLLKVLKDKCPE
jgi:phosphoglycerate kinase